MSAALEKAASDSLFRQAMQSDDQSLREMVRGAPIEGWVTLSYEREPNYFLGGQIEGADHHSFIAEGANGRAVGGMFSLSFRDLFIGRETRKVGYIGQLRVQQSYKKKLRLIADGFAQARSLLKASNAAPFMLTSIISGNHRAERILTSGLRGMPTYCPLGGMNSFAIACGSGGAVPLSGIEIRRGTSEDLGAIASFLQEHLRDYEFAPVWTVRDLKSDEICRDLKIEDFLLAYRAGELVGCCALWDQSGFKQNRVRSYRQPLSLLRPAVNMISGLTGLPKLPRAGSNIRSAFLSHLAVKEADRVVLHALIARARILGKARGLSSLILAGDNRNPLFGLVQRRFRSLVYGSRIYAVHWDEGREEAEQLRERLLQPEIAVL